MNDTGMTMDVIVLSYGRDSSLQELTAQTLRTLHESEDRSSIRFNAIVIESNNKLKPFQYPDSTTLYPEEKFGYNRYLNIGMEASTTNLVCLANNDLRFHRGWATAVITAANQNPDVMSFSPVDPWLHNRLGMTDMPEVVIGYDKMKYFTGWCFVIRRELMQVIGNFDEKLDFWYVDDDYIETIKLHGVSHALVRDAKVDHLSGETIGSVTDKERRRLTSSQWLYFDYKWNHRSPALYMLKRAAYAARKLIRV
jgi:GT2 family glycosyltransferase